MNGVWGARGERVWVHSGGSTGRRKDSPGGESEKSREQGVGTGSDYESVGTWKFADISGFAHPPPFQDVNTGFASIL